MKGVKDMGFKVRKLQISPNVFGGSRGTHMGPVTGQFRNIVKTGVGKDGIAKPKTGAISGRAISSRPVVQGMDTQGRVLKKAKKYWMWIVAAFVAYFVLKR